jgi:transposase-like protein
MELKLKCPYCDSTRLNKSGKRYSGTIRQSYYCRDCHRITVNPINVDNKVKEVK